MTEGNIIKGAADLKQYHIRTCAKGTKNYFLEKVVMQIIFIYMLIEEYQIIFATLKHLKNQRQPVLSMGMKHQGCPI